MNNKTVKMALSEQKKETLTNWPHKRRLVELNGECWDDGQER